MGVDTSQGAAGFQGAGCSGAISQGTRGFQGAQGRTGNRDRQFMRRHLKGEM